VLDADGLKDLAQNPVFRLHMHTSHNVEKLFNHAQQHFDARKERQASRGLVEPNL
jgi:hypothetical protein